MYGSLTYFERYISVKWGLKNNPSIGFLIPWKIEEEYYKFWNMLAMSTFNIVVGNKLGFSGQTYYMILMQLLSKLNAFFICCWW